MPEFRRVSVYAPESHADLALPSGVPVGSLIPQIVDIMAAPLSGVPAHYQLSIAGAAALDESKSLAQHGIRDGSLLVLSASPAPPPTPRFDDPADAVATFLAAAARPSASAAARRTAALAAGWLTAVGTLVLIRTAFETNAAGQVGAAGVLAAAGGIALSAGAIAHRGFGDGLAGLTLGLLAAGFATGAGLLAVPGGPGAPNALLAATAGAATALLALRIIGCGRALFTAVGGFGLLAAAAALAASVGAAPPRVLGAACTLLSLALIETSARVSIRLAGLSPQPAVIAAAERMPAGDDLPARAARADSWLTGLLGAFSAAASLGAIGTLVAVCHAGGSPVGGIAFAATTGATLLARSRRYPGVATAVTFTVTGTLTLSAGFVVAATAGAPRLPWVAVGIAVLAAGTLWLGFLAPALTWSPLARRGVELAEYLVLAAVVPLACWICGLYGALAALTLS
ncbi:type VII secretion integral membrane protein EccD [Mycobacterium sp.]|uniref:type VII secretion integral membrane protein EccD n=1 Tax=Mycobacterium sp. TaxID=1785 RepID=UPI0025EA2417|nr:type VII secretion integral membrane protein EccD [Mycobacterium sp.]